MNSMNPKNLNTFLSKWTDKGSGEKSFENRSLKSKKYLPNPGTNSYGTIPPGHRTVLPRITNARLISYTYKISWNILIWTNLRP